MGIVFLEVQDSHMVHMVHGSVLSAQHVAKGSPGKKHGRTQTQDQRLPFLVLSKRIVTVDAFPRLELEELIYTCSYSYLI